MLKKVPLLLVLLFSACSAADDGLGSDRSTTTTGQGTSAPVTTVAPVTTTTGRVVGEVELSERAESWLEVQKGDPAVNLVIAASVDGFVSAMCAIPSVRGELAAGDRSSVDRALPSFREALSAVPASDLPKVDDLLSVMLDDGCPGSG